MTDEIFGNDPEGTDVESAPGQEQVISTTPTGYVTPDELAAFKREIDDKLSNLYRGIQSQNDKLSHRVQQRIESYERAAAAQGLTLTPSQKQQLTDQTTIEELRAVSQKDSSVAVLDRDKRPGESDDEFINRVNTAAETLMKQAGITFEETDPEVEIINKASEGTAEQYLNAHKEAIRLKKERLAKAGKETPKRNPAGSAPSAIPGTPNANPVANVTDLDELWDLATKR